MIATILFRAVQRRPFWWPPEFALFLAIATAAAQTPITLEQTTVDFEDVDELILVRDGRGLLTVSDAGVRRWDTRSGYPLGHLVTPDGEPVAEVRQTQVHPDSSLVSLITEDYVLTFDRETVETRAFIQLDQVGSVVLGPAGDALLLSRAEGARNWLHRHDFASGESKKIARFRPTVPIDEAVPFEAMQWREDGALGGLTGKHLVVIDPERWRMKEVIELAHEGMTWLPNGQLLRLGGVREHETLYYSLFSSTDGSLLGSGLFRTEKKHLKWRRLGFYPGDDGIDRLLVATEVGPFQIRLDDFSIESQPTFALAALQDEGRPWRSCWDARRKRLYLTLRTTIEGVSQTELVAWSPNTANIVHRYGGDRLLIAASHRVSPQGNTVYARARGSSSVKRLDFSLGQFLVRGDPREDYPLAISADERFRLIRQTTQFDKTLRIVDDSGQTDDRSLRLKGARWPTILSNMTAISFSPDAEKLAVTFVDPSLDDQREVLLFERSTGQLLAQHTLPLPDMGTVLRLPWAALDDTGEILFYLIRTLYPEKTDTLFALDLDAGKLRWSRSLPPGTQLLRTPHGPLVAADCAEAKLVWFEPESGAPQRTLEAPDLGLTADPWHTAVAGNGGDSIFVFPSPETCLHIAARDGAVLRRTPLSEAIETALPIVENRFLLNLQADGAIGIVDLAQGRRVADLHLFERRNDWVAATPDHRFDATPEAQDRLFFRQGERVVPLATLFEQTYTPQLVPRLLRGDRLPSPDLEYIPQPPEVVLSVADFATRGLTVEDDLSAIVVQSETVRLRLETFAGNGLIDEVVLYHNGKALDSTNRGLTVENDVPAPNRGNGEAKEVEVHLLPGDNHFRAVARGADGARSRPSELTLQFDAPASRADGGIRLFLVVVGVNAYENPNYNLNYALPDARAFHDSLIAANAALFTEIHPFLLEDAAVSRSSILRTLREISHQAAPRDVLVFYYAGHGVMSQAAEPEFFLVPPQVTQLYGDDELLAAKAISATDLRHAARQIAAQKQLFILDACQSAGALEDVVMRGAAEEKAIATLARSTGTYWLTATGSEQFAAEFENLGHGVFTYALLEALRGGADGEEGDGQLTVRELDAFLQTRVPELTREHRGTPQYPASYGFGQDFPLSLIHP